MRVEKKAEYLRARNPHNPDRFCLKHTYTPNQVPESIVEEIPDPLASPSKTPKVEKNSTPGSTRNDPVLLYSPSDEEGKATYTFQQQISRSLASLKQCKHTRNSGDTKDLFGKIESFFGMIKNHSPVDKKFNENFLNIIVSWGNSSRHDQSKLIMCEGLYRWMKEHLFVLERKVLLKLEKDLRKTKKFKDNGQTLFTTKSGWALKEVHFNLDGADLID